MYSMNFIEFIDVADRIATFTGFVVLVEVEICSSTSTSYQVVANTLSVKRKA